MISRGNGHHGKIILDLSLKSVYVNLYVSMKSGR